MLCMDENQLLEEQLSHLPDGKMSIIGTGTIPGSRRASGFQFRLSCVLISVNS